jgi:hypothetical protein
VGRAFTPGGGERKKQVLDTGIKVSALDGGGTLMTWQKVGAQGPGAFAPLFSAGKDFVVPSPVSDGAWHHVAVVFPGAGGAARLYVDGADRGDAGLRLPASGPGIEIGSGGGKYLAGLLDEVRIYDRALDAGEIKAVYRREALQGNLINR